MPAVVNEFGAMPAAPDAFDLRLVDLGGGEAMVEVRTTGGAQRSGVDIEIVLDVSGSMATESEVQDAAGNVQRHGFSTLDVCKHAARCVACSLDDTCRLGLVVYDARARVVVGLARVTPAHVARVHAALEKLAPGTSTNLWGGLELGVDELVGGAGDNARAVLLLTDGVPNNSPPEGEVAALRAKRLTKDGSETVAVFAAGFGYALRSDLLLSELESLFSCPGVDEVARREARRAREQRRDHEERHAEPLAEGHVVVVLAVVEALEAVEPVVVLAARLGAVGVPVRAPVDVVAPRVVAEDVADGVGALVAQVRVAPRSGRSVATAPHQKLSMKSSRPGGSDLTYCVEIIDAAVSLVLALVRAPDALVRDRQLEALLAHAGRLVDGDGDDERYKTKHQTQPEEGLEGPAAAVDAAARVARDRRQRDDARRHGKRRRRAQPREAEAEGQRREAEHEARRFDADAADDGPVGDLALGRGGVAAHGGGPDDAADAHDTTAWNSGAVETDASLSLH